MNGGGADIGSDGCTTADTMDGVREGLESSVGNNTRSGSGTAATAASSGERASSGEGLGGGASSRERVKEDAKWEARRRRALIHGFTDFQVPKDW